MDRVATRAENSRIQKREEREETERMRERDPKTSELIGRALQILKITLL